MALRGIKVLEMAYLLPGPFATQMLADMGADVIKIEDPKGDGLRAMADMPGAETMFAALNRGKKSVVVDLLKEEGKFNLSKLMGTADVVVQGFRPGALDRFGFAPHQLREKFPSLVVCSITGYGLNGPLSQRAGHDLNYLALAGVLGNASTPAVLPVQVADIAGGAYPAVVQILAALHMRHSTKKGCLIDVSMTDNAHSMLVLSQSASRGVGMDLDKGLFPLCGSVPCYAIYATKDGRHFTIGALEPQFWKRCVAALGAPELETKALAFGPEADVVKEKIQSIFSAKTFDEWREIFSKVDAMVEPVLSPNEAANSPHGLARNYELLYGKKAFPSLPLQMDGDALVVPRGGKDERKVPKIGEHNSELLSKL